MKLSKALDHHISEEQGEGADVFGASSSAWPCCRGLSATTSCANCRLFRKQPQVAQTSEASRAEIATNTAGAVQQPAGSSPRFPAALFALTLHAHLLAGQGWIAPVPDNRWSTLAKIVPNLDDEDERDGTGVQSRTLPTPHSSHTGCLLLMTTQCSEPFGHRWTALLSHALLAGISDTGLYRRGMLSCCRR